MMPYLLMSDPFEVFRFQRAMPYSKEHNIRIQKNHHTGKKHSAQKKYWIRYPACCF